MIKELLINICKENVRIHLCIGRRGEEGMVDEVRDEETREPVIGTVPGDVGEDGHGAVAEPVHEDRFEHTLGVVYGPADECYSEIINEEEGGGGGGGGGGEEGEEEEGRRGGGEEGRRGRRGGGEEGRRRGGEETRGGDEEGRSRRTYC